MDIYVLRFKNHLGGIISIHGRRQGADAAMAGFSEDEQAEVVIENFELQDMDE